MGKRYNCKICGEYSAKRKICVKCKEEYPYKAASKGEDPRSRAEKHKGVKKHTSSRYI